VVILGPGRDAMKRWFRFLSAPRHVDAVSSGPDRVIASQIFWIRPPFSRLRLAWLHPTLDQVCPRHVARQIEAGAPTYVFVSTN
jgi:hypothetical protein